MTIESSQKMPPEGGIADFPGSTVNRVSD